MKLKRSALAAGAAIAIALGAVPAAHAGIAPSEVKEYNPGEIRRMTADDVPADLTSESGAPQTWYANWVEGEKKQVAEAYMVSSPSMNDREIPVAVIPAKDAEGNKIAGAPTVYMLNGAGGAEQDADWLNQTNGLEFYQDKGVNVVIPQAGAFSYYMDWAEDMNTKYLSGGPQKWESFITEELPGAIEPTIDAGPQRATVGFSMSATSSLLHAQHNPGFYDAVASFSGCAATADTIGYTFAGITVNRGGATAEQMLGEQGSRHNRYNDALLGAKHLKDTKLYVSNSTGLASETDMAGYYRDQGFDEQVASAQAGVLQVEGGVIEAATNRCTHDLKAKTDALGFAEDTHYELRNTGTHSWPTWREDVEKSWNVTIKPAFVEAGWQQ